MKTHIPHNNPVNPTKRILVTTLTALALTLPAASLLAQDEGSSSGSSQTNAPTGPGHPPHGGPHLLPPHAVEILKLTEDQKKQLKELEAEVKAKIESILTPAQLEQLKQLHPHHPPGAEGPQGGPEGGDQTSSTNQPAQ